MENDSSVAMEQPEGAPVDAALAPEQQQDVGTPLSQAFAAETAESSAAGTPGQAKESVPREERGVYGRQLEAERRAYKKASETMRAEFEPLRQELAQMREMLAEVEADRIVAEKNVPREVALELARLRRGVQAASAAEPAGERPRDSQGRFVSAQPHDGGVPQEVRQRATMLMEQNAEIMASGGPNVRELFEKDPTVKQKVSTGEWDFKDAALHYYRTQGQSRAAVPVTVKSPNHTGNARTFSSMSKEAFDAFNARLEKGERFDGRR